MLKEIVNNTTMGIRGLHTCLVKTTPDCIQTVDWSEWSGKRLGIDIQCFLYRAIANHMSPLKVIANQIAHFKQLNITPVYVFDGKAPTEKDTVMQKRRSDRHDANEMCESLRQSLIHETNPEIRESVSVKIRDLESQFPTLTYEIKDEVKKFLYATGTMFICPSCEADTILAYWFRRSVLDAIISFDLDFLPRQSRLLVPNHISSLNSWSDYNPVDICRALRMSQLQFVEFCALLGSDYTPELPIVPWKSALHSIQKKESLATIWSRHTFNNWRQSNSNEKFQAELDMFTKAVLILNGELDDPACLMEGVQWAKWNAGSQEPETLTLDEFHRKYDDWNSEWWALFAE